MSYIWLKEVTINKTEYYRLGESGVYESCHNNVGELFKSLKKLYGKCVSNLYMEVAATKHGKKIGWVFEKRKKYDNSRDTFLCETWISLHEKPDTVTVEEHFLKF